MNSRKCLHFSWHLQVLYLMPLLLVLCAVFLIAGPAESGVTAYFEQLRHANPLATRIIKAISNWSGPLLIAAYCLFALKTLVTKNRAGIRFVITFALVQYGLILLLVYALKFGVGSPRPYAGDIPRQPFSTVSDYHSFPSGHTYETTGLCGPLAHRRGELLALAVGILPAVVGFSRIYLGKHHLIDVLAGALLASVATFLTLRFYARQKQ